MAAPVRPASPGWAYPAARQEPLVEDHFGIPVADPYRWLEDPDSPETRAWIEAENRLTDGLLARIPGREAIRRRLAELWNFERCGPPEHAGSWYLLERNDGRRDQPAIERLASLDDEPEPLLDPGDLAADGTVAVPVWNVSRDGRWLAYALNRAGSDWLEWHVRDVATGRDLADVCRWGKFTGAAWLPDGSGFVYGRFAAPPEGADDAPNRNHELYLHRLGTDQEADALVFARPDRPDWGFDAEVTEDGRWLVVSQTEGLIMRCRLFARDLSDGLAAGPAAGFVPLQDRFDAWYQVIGNDGSTFFLLTDHDAPRGRLVAVELERPEPEAWRELVAEGPDRDVLAQVALAGERFVCRWQVDAHDRLEIRALDGRLERPVELPGIGGVPELTARRADGEARFTFASFVRPPTVYRLDVSSGGTVPWRAPRVSFDPDAYETRQVFYASRDGTRIPMFLTARRDLLDAPDGDLPTYLYGYGGFDVPVLPKFDPATIGWLEVGGLHAVANLRGGSEYGRAWHEAGMLANKQNVFDDFIAAAEWLQREGWTRRERLAIGGRSNGGLLVGACLTQRPELFGAALPAVGVMDMLRFHRFTIGWAWTSDYGDPDVEADFRVLLAYSPLHNIRPGTRYPATLIMTADHDDRVVPGHSFKFAAALQAAQAGPAPILIRIETRAGHGATTPTSKLVAEVTDRWAFLVEALGIALPEEEA